MRNKILILLGFLLIFSVSIYAQLFTEYFDGLVFPPTGWTANGVTRVNSTVTTPQSPPYCVEFDASSDELITPLLPNPDSLVYWHKKGTGNYRYYVQWSHNPTGPWTDFLLTDYMPALAPNDYPIWAANAWVGGNSPIHLNLTSYENIYIHWIPQSVPPPAKIFYLDSVSMYLEEECVPPEIPPSNVTFPYIGVYSLGIQWTRGDGDYCVAFMHEGPGTPVAPVDGTVYDPSTDWSMPGTQLDASGYYCIYRGTGNNVTVTNLLPLTNYWVVVYEFNCDGVAAHFLSTGAEGNATTLEPQVPVELSTFTANLDQQYFVQLHWVTQSETAAIGYNVYRNDTNNTVGYYRVNPYTIPASNTSTESNYYFTDREASLGTWYYWLEVKNLDGSSDFFGPISITITDGTGSPNVPDVSGMSSIYPNPFYPGGTYLTGTFQLSKSDDIRLAIYNVKGQKVRTLAEGNRNAGTYPISWDGMDENNRACSSGIYYMILKTTEYITSKKIVLMK